VWANASVTRLLKKYEEIMKALDEPKENETGFFLLIL
jgi:hypothetical protein